jgi:hypothetical protein
MAARAHALQRVLSSGLSLFAANASLIHLLPLPHLSSVPLLLASCCAMAPKRSKSK